MGADSNGDDRHIDTSGSFILFYLHYHLTCLPRNNTEQQETPGFACVGLKELPKNYVDDGTHGSDGMPTASAAGKGPSYAVRIWGRKRDKRDERPRKD